MTIEKHIEINNTRVCLREAGKGVPLILVHGMGSSIVWDDVLDGLAMHSRVVIIDLPGFGKSDKPKINYSIDYYSEILREFIEKEYREKINLVGMSLGGMICADYCSKHQQSIDNLILVSSAGLKTVAEKIKNPLIYMFTKFVLKTVIFSNRKALKKFQQSSFYDPSGIPEIYYKKFYKLMAMPGARDAYLSILKIVAEERLNFRQTLSKISVKTLLVWGKNDPTFPLNFAHEFLSLIKDSDLKIISNCGHTVPVEKPHEFVDLINKFLGVGNIA